MTTTAVHFDVAKSLVQVHLRALRNFRLDAEDGLARAITDCALSVPHAEATLKEFDHECPTPREIKDTALNLKPKFQPPENQIEKWKAEGYTYEPGFKQSVIVPFRKKNTRPALNQIPKNYQEALVILAAREPGGPTLYDLMCLAIKARLRVNDVQAVPWGQWWHAAQEMGFPLQRDEAGEPVWEPTGRQRQQIDTWLMQQPSDAVVSPADPVPAIPETKRRRCDLCQSTGRTEEGYCNCQTGRDLAGVERPL